jgi:tetratricopeptide (TPR) repeat protein
LPRLLVFDNCEDEALLDRWRPRTGGSHVLLTSRRDTWSPDLGVHARALGTLARPESTALLGRLRPDLDPAEPVLGDIADELGDLPLALHLAGSYLARYRHSEFAQPANYLLQLRQPDLLSHRSLTIGDRSPTGHEQHVARTFALSYDRLDEGDAVNALARTSLACAACFAPGEPIPRRLLRLSTGVEENAGGELRFENSLARLRDLGLLAEQSDGALTLHRLLVAFVQSETNDAPVLRPRVDNAVAAEAERLNSAGHLAALLRWELQLRFVAQRAAEEGTEAAAALLSELGLHLGKVGDVAGNKAACERALQLDEARFGPNHPTVAVRLNNLGLALQDFNDVSGALKAFERALAIDKANFGPDHATVARDLSNLGSWRHSRGDLLAAKLDFERALGILEKDPRPNSRTVAAVISNLGGVLLAQHDLPGANEICQRALKIGEACIGPKHPDVAILVNNMGGVLLELGDLSSAQTAFERALPVLQTHFGSCHWQVGMLHNNLGGVLLSQNDLPGARTAFERALAILDHQLGSDHPMTRNVRDNLSGLDGG